MKKVASRKLKSDLHPRNKHIEKYDFKLLVDRLPELAPFVFTNKYQSETIDFSDPLAVKLLNKALLICHYKIQNWDIPEGFLTPPIPGRADYIHYVADLLAESNKGNIPAGNEVNCLDIGVGANCIYPLIAASEYGWSIIGSDTDMKAVESAQKIIDSNSHLLDLIQIKQQANTAFIFKGVIEKDELYDLTICNPPFHSSVEEADASARRKLRNLGNKRADEKILNFGGKSNELWYDGGEMRFLKVMIEQSKEFSKLVFWFTSLVSKESNLKEVYRLLKNQKVANIRTIEMGTANKRTRFVAWTYHNKEEITKWTKKWK